MRYIKHMVNANRDEKLQKLKDQFGLEGYGAYWHILEILAEQIKNSDRDFCEYSLKFWQNSLGFSPKKLRNFLGICSEFEIFSVKFSQNSVIISCPKIKTIRDEWTSRKNSKLPSDSRVTPERNKDKDKDKYIKKINKKNEADASPPQPPTGGSENFKNLNSKNNAEEEFKTWYGLYPNKTAKAHALKAFLSARKKASLEELIQGLENYKKTKPDYAAWKHPATWLNGECWEDDTGTPKTSPVLTRIEQVRQAYLQGQVLKHPHLGIVEAARLSPVGAAYQKAEITEAKFLRLDDGNAYPVQEFSTG